MPCGGAPGQAPAPAREPPPGHAGDVEALVNYTGVLDLYVRISSVMYLIDMLLRRHCVGLWGGCVPDLGVVY